MNSNGKRFAGIWVAAALLVIGTSVAAWAALHRAATAPIAKAPADLPTRFSPSTWKWRNEAHWAMDQMVSDTTEMLLRAAGESAKSYVISVVPDRSGPHAYQAAIRGPRIPQGITRTLVLKDHLWDPTPLSTWARDLSSALQIRPSGERHTQPSPLVQLLSPTPLNLEKIQSQVSRHLTQFPASPDLHEEGAAILSVFGLFHAPGIFEDNRATLCRIASHLAVAEALRGSGATPTAERQLAATALLAMTGQTRKAVAALEQIEASGKGALPQPWIRVLDTHARRDWRMPQNPATASLAEVMATFRAQCYRLPTEDAQAWLGKTAFQFQSFPAYFTRSVFLGGYSVRQGHELTPEALEHDLKDFQQVYAQRHQGRQPRPSEHVSLLNAAPGRTLQPDGTSLEILDWGLWARHFQAALLLDMIYTFDFLQEKWGVPEEATRYLDGIEATYQGLDLFPVLQKRCSYVRSSWYPEAILKAADFCRKHPELVPDSAFVCVNQVVAQGRLPLGMPRYQDWLTVPTPHGTTYNMVQRTWEMEELSRLKAPDLEAFRALDPYDAWLIKKVLKTQFPDSEPTPAAIEKAFAESKDVAEQRYLEWMIDAVGEANPDCLPLLKRSAELDPSNQFDLGHALRRQKREEEAAAAYLAGFQQCPDRVQASNQMKWLVTYLHRTKRTAEAERIAEACADVYSARGLETMATLRELQGRLPEAEDWFRKIEERYDTPDGLVAFYRRHPMDNVFRTKLEHKLRKVFPHGLKPHVPPPPSSAPRRGVRFAGSSSLLTRCGIRPSAIVVALDGYAVENQQQYLTVRGFSEDDAMELVIFQDGAYRTVHATVPGRRFGTDLVDYTAP